MSEKVESNEVAGNIDENMAEKKDTETTAIEGLLMDVAETNEISKDIEEDVPDYEETTEEPNETTKNNDENMSEKSETNDITKNIDENVSEKVETIEKTENNDEKSEATKDNDENMSEKSETKDINEDEKISEKVEDPYFDDNLVDIIEKCEGGVPEFIDKMFNFLSRKTDFYTGKSSKSIVMEAFKKYDKGKENDTLKKR